MSATFLSTPEKVRPAFNPVMFYLDSAYNENEGYKYIIDILTTGATPTMLARKKLFPRPVDSYGETDLSTILQTQVGSFLNQDLHSFSKCEENYFNFNVRIGEEYVQYWSFLINYDNGGNLTLSGNAATHPFAVGDYVLVDYTTPNTIGDNVFEVLSVPSSNAITINTTYLSGGSSSPYWGTAVYSNKRKTIFTGQTIYSGYSVFNGAVGFRDIDSWSSSTYNLSATTATTVNTKKFLTNVPNTFTVRPENSMWLNMYCSAFTSNVSHLEINTGGNSIYFPNPISSTETKFQTVACGVYDIKHFATSATCIDASRTIMSGSLSTFFTCDTNTYSARTVFNYTESSIDSGGTITYYVNEFLPSSEWKIFNINNNTASRFTNVELYFMDRLGSIIPWNFEFMSARQINKTNSQYKTIFGELNSANRWAVNSTDAGIKQINTVVIEQMTVTTGWLNEAESTYFAELLTSPRVYIKEFGKLYPVIIKTAGVPIYSKANRKNISQQILIEYAVNNPIQNI